MDSSLKIKGSGGSTGIQFEDSGGTTDGYIYANGGSHRVFRHGGKLDAFNVRMMIYIRFSVKNQTLSVCELRLVAVLA